MTDYSATGASNVKLGIGPTTVSLGGEIGYTPQGGLITDVTGRVQTSFSDTYGRSGQVSIDGSARRGNSLSVRAEQNFNPYSSEFNGFIKDATAESLGGMFSIDTAMKEQLWTGKFTL